MSKELSPSMDANTLVEQFLRMKLGAVEADNVGKMQFSILSQLAEYVLKSSARPTDDELWDETLKDRDQYHEWADRLTHAIAEYFGQDFGEHSNMNCPWAEAVEFLEGLERYRQVRFVGIDPMNPAKGASFPMIPDSWGYKFTDNGDGTLSFGYHDNGDFIARKAVEHLLNFGLQSSSKEASTADAEDTQLSKVDLEWAVSRWNAEVKNRPLVNVHRRSLDDTWRQVIRYFGGDDRALIGPTHDELLAALREQGGQS